MNKAINFPIAAKDKRNLWVTLIFGLVWLSLALLNLNWSRDITGYLMWYEDGRKYGLASIDWQHDPAYFLLSVSCSPWLPFKFFISGIIGFCLFIKWKAINQLIESPSFSVVFPYLTVLGFLHEGTQLRIAIALSFALWSLVFWSKRKYMSAFFMLIFAGLFHISAITFLGIYFLVWLSDHFGKKVYLAIFIIAGILAFSDIFAYLILEIGRLFNMRYLAYAQGAIFKTLNVTGLFQYFFIFVGTLTGLAFFLKPYIEPKNERFWLFAIVCGAVGVMVLIDIRFNTVIASRFADLLLLPVTIAIGLALPDLKKNRKTLYWLILVVLSGYALTRGYTVFTPRPEAPVPTIN